MLSGILSSALVSLSDMVKWKKMENYKNM